MASFSNIVVLSLLAILPIFASGDTCLGPTLTSSKFYSTHEAQMSTDTVFIVEFTLSCKNGLRNINLYADMNGQTVPATKAGENKYQVSFSGEHKKLSSGTYNIRFFDEEGYAALRKAQRSSEDTAAIPALFSVPLSHQGASTGPWLQSEFVASALAVLVWYMAYNGRQKLQA